MLTVEVAPIPQLRTPGVLAKTLGIPLHRVLYVLRTRPHIRPAARAGRLRLYHYDAMALIRHEVNAMDARRLPALAGRQAGGVAGGKGADHE